MTFQGNFGKCDIFPSTEELSELASPEVLSSFLIENGELFLFSYLHGFDQLYVLQICIHDMNTFKCLLRSSSKILAYCAVNSLDEFTMFHLLNRSETTREQRQLVINLFDEFLSTFGVGLRPMSVQYLRDSPTKFVRSVRMRT